MDRIYTEQFNETHKKVILIVKNDKEIPKDLLDIHPNVLLDFMWITKKIFNLTIEVKNKEDDNYFEDRYYEKAEELEEEYNNKIEEFVKKIEQHETNLEYYKKEIETMRKDYDKTLSIERTQRRTLEQSIQEKDNAMKAFELNINRLIEKSTETIEKRHNEETKRIIKQYEEEKVRFEKNIKKLEDMIREEKGRLEVAKKEEILRLETGHKGIVDTMKKFYEQDKRRMDNELVELNNQLYDAQTNITKLENIISINKSAVIKGATGQNNFFELVKQHTSWTGVEDTSKISRAGDLRGYIDKVETMFEIKNYISDVPSKEVIKMLRDLETHSNVSYGVFISMNSGISGKKKAIDFQWTAHGQLCMFISYFLNNDMEMIFNYIEQCASIAHRFFTTSNVVNNGELESYKDKLLQVKLIITKQITEISEMISTMAHHKRLQMDNLNKHYTEYKLMLEKMKLSCNEIVGIVVGDVVDDVEVEHSDVDVVVETKKRGRKKKSDL
jgi:hypothetical protein